MAVASSCLNVATTLRPVTSQSLRHKASMTPWPVAVLFGGKVPFSASLITRTTLLSIYLRTAVRVLQCAHCSPAANQLLDADARDQ